MNCLLPKKVARNKCWSGAIHNYSAILTSAPPDSPGKKYITSSDQALVAVLYENCGQRFPYLASLGNKKFDRCHPQYQSAYSSSESGSQKFGGWSVEGRERYKEILTWVRKSKKAGRAVPLETSILAEIQKELDITPGEDKKRKSREPQDFENDERAHAPVGVESDDMKDLDDEDVSTPKYRAPPKKKSKKSKKKSNSRAQNYEGSGQETKKDED